MTTQRVFFVPLLLAAVGCSKPAIPQLPTAEEKPTNPVVRVVARYPGANAQVLADTVAAHIEKEVNGAEGVERLESESRDDGSYTLAVRFKAGTDGKAALAAVQDRVKRADPKLPDEVRRQGITVGSHDPSGFPALWVVLTSPDDTRDGLFLCNYAALKVRDELARVTGVVHVRAVGGNASVMRIWIDADKLTARKLTMETLTAAIQRQDVQLAVGKGQYLIATSLGRLSKVEDLESIVVNTGEDKQVVYLRDVARVELGASGGNGFARANGMPAAILAVHAQTDDKTTAEGVQKAVADIQKVAPKGVKAELLADPGTVVELRLPSAARIDRTEEATQRAEKLLADLNGVAGTLAFAEGTGNVATLLVKPAGKNPATTAGLRKALGELREAAARVSDVSAGRPFPVRLALTDSGAHGDEKLRQWADAVARRLERDGLAADPAADPGPPVSRLLLNINREKAEQLGVRVDDIIAALQANLGSVHVNDFNKYGRTWQVAVQPDRRDAPDGLTRLEVRAGEGKTVKLSAFAEANSVLAPSAVFRVNQTPALRITAAVPDGKNLAESVARCAEVTETVRKELKLPDSFKVVRCE